MSSNHLVTLLDVQLAAVYYPILVEKAKQKRTITYGELVKEAKTRFAERKCVDSALAVSAGRRLDVVRAFTRDRGLPDVSSLVVNAAHGECGRGFTDSFDPNAVRAQVFAEDWNKVETCFDEYIDSVEVRAVEVAKPRKRLSRKEIGCLVWDFYKENKHRLPGSIGKQREHIINWVADGLSVADAYARATAKL